MSLLNSSRAGALLVVIAGACLVRLESPFDPVVWEHVSAHRDVIGIGKASAVAVD